MLVTHVRCSTGAEALSHASDYSQPHGPPRREWPGPPASHCANAGAYTTSWWIILLEVGGEKLKHKQTLES